MTHARSRNSSTRSTPYRKRNALRNVTTPGMRKTAGGSSPLSSSSCTLPLLGPPRCLMILLKLITPKLSVSETDGGCTFSGTARKSASTSTPSRLKSTSNASNKLCESSPAAETNLKRLTGLVWDALSNSGSQVPMEKSAPVSTVWDPSRSPAIQRLRSAPNWLELLMLYAPLYPQLWLEQVVHHTHKKPRLPLIARMLRMVGLFSPGAWVDLSVTPLRPVRLLTHSVRLPAAPFEMMSLNCSAPSVIFDVNSNLRDWVRCLAHPDSPQSACCPELALFAFRARVGSFPHSHSGQTTLMRDHLTVFATTEGAVICPWINRCHSCAALVIN